MKYRGIMKKLPNIITSIRLLMVPVFICIFIMEWRENQRVTFALAVFVITFLSDLLDGYLARKYDAVSAFGKLVDPLADKLLAISAIVCLWRIHFLPMIVLIVIGAKELALIIGSAFLYKRKITVCANWAGKITAFMTNVSVMLCFLHNYLKPWDWYLLYLAIGLQMFALAQYVYVNVVKAVKEGRLFRR